MKIILSIGLALTVFHQTGCKKSEAPSDPVSVHVENGQVSFDASSPSAAAIITTNPAPSAGRVVGFNGRLVWDDNFTTRLFTPFSGRVTAVRVEQGDRVEAGTALAIIASPDFGQFQADARRAATDLVLAERTLARVRELFAHGAAPQKEVQTAEADAEHAQLEKQRTVERLALYGVSTNGVDQAYVFRSPISGVVVEKNINNGSELRADLMLANTPQLAAPQFIISEPERLWVFIDVSERDQPKIQVGQKIIVRSASFPEKTFAGRIDMIGDSLDPNSRTVKVRGSVANPGRMLKAEMFVRAEIALSPESGVSLPAKAVFLHGNHHCVIVQDSPGKFSRKEVTLGSESAQNVIISSGLSLEQPVVVEGNMLIEQLLNSGS